MSKYRFLNVSLPEELVRLVDNYLGRYGYRSRADFIVDAVRRRIEELARKEVAVANVQQQ